MKESDLLFFLGAIFWIAPVLFIAWRRMPINLEYMKQYREVHRLDLPVTPGEISARYADRPWRWVVDAPPLLLKGHRAFAEPQEDPSLERLRTQSNRLGSLSRLLIFGGAIWPLLLPQLAK
jgi:hypothetical protein